MHNLHRLPAHVADLLLLYYAVVAHDAAVVLAPVEEYLLRPLVADVAGPVLGQVLLYLLAQEGDLGKLGDRRQLLLRLVAFVVLQKEVTDHLGLGPLRRLAQEQIIV